MRVTVGGVVVQEANPVVIVSKEEVVRQVNNFGRAILPLGLGAGVLNVATFTKAAQVGTGLADKLQPLIHLVQDLALPVGICAATWGVIEIMLGNPSGTKKIKNSVIGFVGIFIIPFVFYAVRDALQGGIS